MKLPIADISKGFCFCVWEVDLIAFVVLGSCWLGYLNAPKEA